MIAFSELKKLRFFSAIPADDLQRFLSKSAVRHYKQAATIFSAFEEHDTLYLLLSGVVKTYVITPKGMEQIIHLFYPGDAFGGLMFKADGNDSRPWAIALDTVALITVTESGFKQMMADFPDVCMNVFHYTAEHHQQHIRRLQTLLHTKSSNRLVLTLLHIGDRQGDGTKAQFTLKHGFTHEDLANMIGVVRTTLSESIADLRRRGIVLSSGKTLTVDRAAARAFLKLGRG